MRHYFLFFLVFAPAIDDEIGVVIFAFELDEPEILSILGDAAI